MCVEDPKRVNLAGSIAAWRILAQLCSMHGRWRLKACVGNSISAAFLKFDAIAGVGVAMHRDGTTPDWTAGATRSVACFFLRVPLAGTCHQ